MFCVEQQNPAGYKLLLTTYLQYMINLNKLEADFGTWACLYNACALFNIRVLYYVGGPRPTHYAHIFDILEEQLISRQVHHMNYT